MCLKMGCITLGKTRGAQPLVWPAFHQRRRLVPTHRIFFSIETRPLLSLVIFEYINDVCILVMLMYISFYCERVCMRVYVLQWDIQEQNLCLFRDWVAK